MRTTILLSFLLFNLFCEAQKYYDDAQLWLDVNFEKKIIKKLHAQLSLKGRGTDNFTQFGRGAADIGISYKFSKNLKVNLDYVFVQKKRNDNSYKTQHQYYLSLVLKKEIGRFKFNYRNMLQCQINNYNTNLARYYDRNKITIKYELSKRYAAYLAEEVNIPLNNQQLKGISRSRSFIGTQIKLSQKQQLDFYFMYQIQIQKGDWYKQDEFYYASPLKRKFVYGISYSFTL